MDNSEIRLSERGEKAAKERARGEMEFLSERLCESSRELIRAILINDVEEVARLKEVVGHYAYLLGE